MVTHESLGHSPRHSLVHKAVVLLPCQAQDVPDSVAALRGVVIDALLCLVQQLVEAEVIELLQRMHGLPRDFLMGETNANENRT